MKFSAVFIFGFILCTSCKDVQKEPAISTEQAPKLEVERVAIDFKEAESFDFPVGKPDAKGYYNAQVFGENNHLGDDWNGVGGGNTDLGDSVFAIGNGQVVFAENIHGGWGNVVRIVHRHKGKLYESLYAHLDTITVKKDQVISKGEKLGTIGNADGIYLAHLHLEIRDTINMEIGGGYSLDTDGYIDPTKFIKAH